MELIKCMATNPIVSMLIPISMMRLGPYLSFAHPPKGPATPFIIVLRPEAIDVAARLKPNSSDKGLK